MVKYTNAQVSEIKDSLFTDIVDGNEVFNQQSFDDWVVMQEAKGNSFPKARNNQLIQVQPLFRVVEANKAGVSEAKFKEIYKATAKAQNIKTPKKDTTKQNK